MTGRILHQPPYKYAYLSLLCGLQVPDLARESDHISISEVNN